jgi:hypothetical protein
MNIKTAGNKRFLYDINTDFASAKEKIAWLNNIIDNEMKKPDKKVDTGLVSECLDYIDQLSDKSLNFSADELIYKCNVITSEVKRPELVIRPRKVKRMVLKTAAIIAIILALSFTTLSIMADVEGYSSTWEFIVKYAKEIFNMEPGSTADIGGVTFHKPVGTVEYESIEELIENENLDIMYPTWAPEDVRITEIQKIDITDTEWQLTFIYNDIKYNTFIRNYYLNNAEMAAGRETYEYNGVKYYIKKVNNEWYQAYCQYNGYEYSFKSADYDSLLKIINSMKGIPNETSRESSRYRDHPRILLSDHLC